MSKIFISPSTQEKNLYAGGGNEEMYMRRLSSKVCDLLVDAGHIVKMGGTVSATSNKNDSNAWKAHYHVSIHSNAGGGHGTEVWHYPTSTIGAKLAKAIYKFLAPASNEPDRGVKSSAKYVELAGTNAPAVIVEVAFHDNLKEANEIKASLDEFALAIVKGILEVTGGSLPVPEPPAEFVEFRIHGAAADAPFYAQVAAQKRDAIRMYKTSQKSFLAWPQSDYVIGGK